MLCFFFFLKVTWLQARMHVTKQRSCKTYSQSKDPARLDLSKGIDASIMLCPTLELDANAMLYSHNWIIFTSTIFKELIGDA